MSSGCSLCYVQVDEIHQLLVYVLKNTCWIARRMDERNVMSLRVLVMQRPEKVNLPMPFTSFVAALAKWSSANRTRAALQVVQSAT